MWLVSRDWHAPLFGHLCRISSCCYAGLAEVPEGWGGLPEDMRPTQVFCGRGKNMMNSNLDTQAQQTPPSQYTLVAAEGSAVAVEHSTADSPFNNDQGTINKSRGVYAQSLLASLCLGHYFVSMLCQYLANGLLTRFGTCEPWHLRAYDRHCTANKSQCTWLMCNGHDNLCTQSLVARHKALSVCCRHQ